MGAISDCSLESIKVFAEREAGKQEWLCDFLSELYQAPVLRELDVTHDWQSTDRLDVTLPINTLLNENRLQSLTIDCNMDELVFENLDTRIGESDLEKIREFAISEITILCPTTRF